MRERERQLARRKLDKELKYYQWAGREENPTEGLLRAVRHALGVPVAEMLRKLEMSPSVLFRLEQSEMRGTISVNGLYRVAQAMGCHLIYAVVPENGKTLEELAEKRLGARRWGRGRDQGSGVRDQGTEDGDLAKRRARGRVGEGNGVWRDLSSFSSVN